MPQRDTLLKRLGSNYTDGYGNLPIPSGIDSEVDSLLELMPPSHSKDRDAIISGMTSTHGDVLNAFAERMAAQAVRKNEPLFILRALSALAIAAKLSDTREVIQVMSLLYRSIEKLGLDAQLVFASEGIVGADALRDIFNDFINRTNDERSIAAMGYEESADADGFRFKYIASPITSFEELMKIIAPNRSGEGGQNGGHPPYE